MMTSRPIKPIVWEDQASTYELNRQGQTERVTLMLLDAMGKYFALNVATQRNYDEELRHELHQPSANTEPVLVIPVNDLNWEIIKKVQGIAVDSLALFLTEQDD